jgi:single-stranded-DNA-specific exonuclease
MIEVVSRKKREIIDHRSISNPLEQLPVLSLPADTLLWAEGTDRKAVSGVSHYDLSPARILAIWTVPPGPAELRQAVNSVKPETIYLFGNAPAEMTPEAFLSRLAGMVKYAINQRGGRATLSELASAMAAREAAVRAGLEWLKSSGQVEVREEPPGEFSITAAGSESDDESRGRWMSILKFVIDETNAYRQVYLRAEKESLIP